jgi:hypothetical protein
METRRAPLGRRDQPLSWKDGSLMLRDGPHLRDDKGIHAQGPRPSARAMTD